MKRTIFIATVLALLSANVMAGPGGERKGPNMERITQKLELTDSQAAQFESIMTEQREIHRARFDALREQGKSPEMREQMKQERDVARQETRAALSSVLTAEQLDKFEQMMEKRAERHRDRRRNKDNDETGTEL